MMGQGLINLFLLTVHSHHFPLALAAEEGWGPAHVGTQKLQDDEEQETVPAGFSVPFQQPAAHHQTQLQVKVSVFSRGHVRQLG